ncbi:hypothetical protein [Cohnella rhizosphaerae]|uniref:Uncharacterized protein n=1 Tax=Cohnella rhizosphaerae TaxID=1457232 RepID=A0A9X4QT80_9BACL|nr:hypothetical protein [Cohnella rhizosphaerae]MDG0810851.1 hypothetical protein [Cohnella rhizosphaerae]
MNASCCSRYWSQWRDCCSHAGFPGHKHIGDSLPQLQAKIENHQLGILRTCRFCTAMPANIHLSSSMSAVWDKIDAKAQLFSFISRISGFCFGNTCIIDKRSYFPSSAGFPAFALEIPA